ncbi:hypothetical protein D3C71_2156940 [compost metagenome]
MVLIAAVPVNNVAGTAVTGIATFPEPSIVCAVEVTPESVIVRAAVHFEAERTLFAASAVLSTLLKPT